MIRFEPIEIPALVLALVLFLIHPVLADVVPGDVIDVTNWEKVRGLLPESVVTWVKEGKIVLNVGELNYEPRDYWPPFVLETEEKNVGKYALADDHWIVEAGAGKRAEYIVGLPFPEIDPADPKAGEKIMYNRMYLAYTLGDIRGGTPLFLVSSSDYERSLGIESINAAMDGNPKYAERANPDGLLQQQIIVVRAPYDMAGMAIMTWRFRDPGKQDTVFGYSPMIRRVRRMSPANRSDSLFGADGSNDDVAIYSGKIAAMEWKLLRKQEALPPFSYKDPGLLVQNEEGEWETEIKGRTLRYGYEKEGWQGAPWAPVDWIWVKRPTYVIELKPKDRYYNYGIQYIWIGAEVPSPAYKIIHDRSGKYWMTTFKSRMVAKSADGTMHLTIMGDQVTLDERANHASMMKGVDSENVFTYFANLDVHLFSFAGFQKYCK